MTSADQMKQVNQSIKHLPSPVILICYTPPLYLPPSPPPPRAVIMILIQMQMNEDLNLNELGFLLGGVEVHLFCLVLYL